VQSLFPAEEVQAQAWDKIEERARQLLQATR
jgi:hypothetical protein